MMQQLPQASIFSLSQRMHAVPLSVSLFRMSCSFLRKHAFQFGSTEHQSMYILVFSSKETKSVILLQGIFLVLGFVIEE